MGRFIKNGIKLLVVAIIFGGCISQKKRLHTIPFDMEAIEMTDSFEMRIIDYIPSFSCGGIASASNCMGQMTNGDTIRVLTLCNIDTTFKSNQIVKVIPEKKPSFGVSVGVSIYYDSIGNKIIYNPKVIYGRLIKK